MFSPAFSVSSSSLPAFFLSFFFFLAFLAPSFRVFYNLLTVLMGCFTSIGLIHLSLLLSSPFSFLFLFSFLSSLFSFFPPFSSFSLSLRADFWCGDRRHAAPLPTGLPAIKFIGKQLVWKVANILAKLRYLWKCEIWGNILKIWYFVNNYFIEVRI